MVKKDEKFTKGIAFVREKINPDFAIGQLLTFLLIGENEGILTQDIIKELKQPAGTISRNLKHLGQYLVRGGDHSLLGYGLVTTRPDMLERRCSTCHLTDKGRQLFNQLIELTNNGR
ncbi:MAG: hypothetical protein LLF28_07880 [Nitrospiraceae bacterium]|nr:hypothetical protein [Nitrospiraceae bacterium]